MITQNNKKMSNSFLLKSGTRKMTHQRKQMLKSLMLNKAREDLKRETERKAEEKKAALEKRLVGLGDLSSLPQQDLMVSYLFGDIFGGFDLKLYVKISFFFNKKTPL